MGLRCWCSRWYRGENVGFGGRGGGGLGSVDVWVWKGRLGGEGG